MANNVDTNKSKGGRPPKETSDLRNNHVKVGFTDLEYDSVQYKAQQVGKRTPNYVHDASLNARVRSHINEEQVELVRDIAKMGNNVNQVAKKANQSGYVAMHSYCKKTVDRLSLLITRILRGGDLSQ